MCIRDRRGGRETGKEREIGEGITDRENERRERQTDREKENEF